MCRWSRGRRFDSMDGLKFFFSVVFRSWPGESVLFVKLLVTGPITCDGHCTFLWWRNERRAASFSLVYWSLMRDGYLYSTRLAMP